MFNACVIVTFQMAKRRHPLSLHVCSAFSAVLECVCVCVCVCVRVRPCGCGSLYVNNCILACRYAI